MLTLKRLCVALSLVAFASSAFAADSYKFHLVNKTTKYTITGFQTYENDKWSTWSGVSLAPGEEQDMDWGSNEGKCVVPFRVVYAEIQSLKTIDYSIACNMVS